jgi:adenylate kinase
MNDHINVFIVSIPGVGTTPVVPNIPSMILTMNQIR